MQSIQAEKVHGFVSPLMRCINTDLPNFLPLGWHLYAHRGYFINEYPKLNITNQKEYPCSVGENTVGVHISLRLLGEFYFM